MKAKSSNKETITNDKKHTIVIEKDFSLNTIETIKADIDTILDNNKELHLEFKKIESFDLSSIQFLYALKQKLGNNLSFNLDLKPEIKTIINHNGLDKIINS
ncbi:MAG TPA: hypothetical protein PK252_11310 [Bacteroidales bacterium]|nr:hypothetical protein [Bacteroidales bacterium]